MNLTARTEFSGKQLFNGIFFFQNEQMASEIPFLRNMNASFGAPNEDVALELQRISEITTDYIGQKHPNFFDDLKTAIYSNDYFRISEAFKKSGSIIEESLAESTEYKQIALMNSELKNDKEMAERLKNLDPNNDEDFAELERIFGEYFSTQEASQRGLFGIFYALAAVVSIAAVVYSVVNWVVYWDIRDAFKSENNGSQSISKEQFIRDVAIYFNEG